MGINYQNQLSCSTVNQEKIIYEHLKKYLKAHSPEEVILEFSCIFLEGTSQNALVRNVLEDIISSQIKQEKYFYILNYCFYIIIGQWLKTREVESYIFQLIEIFNNIENKKNKIYSRKKKKILSLTQEFIKSKYYQKIQRIACVLNYQLSKKIEQGTIIDDLLARYTYLYKPLLIGKDNIAELTELIQELQINRTKSFEFKLAQHIIYQTRLIEIAKAQQLSYGAGKIIRRIPNPTLLSNKDLRLVLKQYIKKIDSKVTLYQLSRNFIVNNQREISYREFKRNLYFYLIYNLEPKHSSYDFQGKLWNILDGVYYQSDTLLLTDNLIFRTSRKLYQHLIINNSEKKQHNLLISLITYLGTAQTVMLLVKIVLICPAVKPDLEQRISILYSCYEGKTIEYVPWLVKFLEHFLIAFSIYFGKIDISLAKTI